MIGEIVKYKSLVRSLSDEEYENIFYYNIFYETLEIFKEDDKLEDEKELYQKAEENFLQILACIIFYGNRKFSKEDVDGLSQDLEFIYPGYVKDVYHDTSLKLLTLYEKNRVFTKINLNETRDAVDRYYFEKRKESNRNYYGIGNNLLFIFSVCVLFYSISKIFSDSI